MALPQRQSQRYRTNAAALPAYAAQPHSFPPLEDALLTPLPYSEPLQSQPQEDPRQQRVRQLSPRKPSRLAWAGQVSMLIFLGFGLLQLSRALIENLSDILLLSQEASHIVAYHDAAATKQHQLASAIRYYGSPQGQQALIRNELGYVSGNEILVKYR
ncbi:MAG: hypothetical protein QE263_00800 [Vampirovibrionales bacterium]|nr:hypothetical protein [Vampirovibrionales bacterium]